jgi:predicted phosphodiesterase
MRLLVFSDIHNNIGAVRALREVEPNEYDAVVVAGDIGGEIATEFRGILGSFGCPGFYVHGNWDHIQPYDLEPSKDCMHLHQRLKSHCGYVFAGFSGCPTHWGKNPYYLEATAVVEAEHSTTLLTLAAIRAEAERLAETVEVEFRERGQRLLKRKARVGDKEHRKARDQLRAWRDRKLVRFYEPADQFKRSEAYRSYWEARFNCSAVAYKKNRQALFEMIRSASVPSDRLILVTHERMFKLADEGFAPLLHIFGHRHEFKFNSFKGTYYLNAAALDPSLYIASEGINRSPGGYCRLTIQDGNIAVERRTLRLDKDHAPRVGEP